YALRRRPLRLKCRTPSEWGTSSRSLVAGPGSDRLGGCSGLPRTRGPSAVPLLPRSTRLLCLRELDGDERRPNDPVTRNHRASDARSHWKPEKQKTPSPRSFARRGLRDRPDRPTRQEEATIKTI